MTKDQITALARKHGTSYTNRHFLEQPAFAFGNESWAAFCGALVAAQPPTVEACGVIEQCRDALAEELAGWDLDPPLHHVKQVHDKCVEWLSHAAKGSQMNKEQMAKVLDALKMQAKHFFVRDAEKVGLSEAIQILQDAIAQPVQPTKHKLTSDKLNQMWCDAVDCGDPLQSNAHLRFARAIEAAHGIGSEGGA